MEENSLFKKVERFLFKRPTAKEVRVSRWWAFFGICVWIFAQIAAFFDLGAYAILILPLTIAAIVVLLMCESYFALVQEIRAATTSLMDIQVLCHEAQTNHIKLRFDSLLEELRLNALKNGQKIVLTSKKK